MRFKRLTLPIGAFVCVWVVHYLWLMWRPEEASSQSQWIALDSVDGISPWQKYIAGQSYFLSYTYALSVAFAVYTYRRYRENQACGTGRVTAGVLGFSAVLSTGSCFLLGCCGSPMLGVYLSFLGAGFLPFAKPLIAGISTAMICLAVLRIAYRGRKQARDCGCEVAKS